MTAGTRRSSCSPMKATRSLTPNPATYTVPDEAQLRGDFSNLRDAQGRLITIYDPATGRLVNGQWVRDPFPDNSHPGRPHQSGRAQLCRSISCGRTRRRRPATRGATTSCSRRTWPRTTFHNYATKVDQNISGRPRCSSATPTTSARRRATPTASPSGPAQDGQLPLERINKSGVADWVRTMSSSFVLNVRVGLNQYLELARSDPGLGFNPRELGFPSNLVGQLPNQVFPRINLWRRLRARLGTTISGTRPRQPQQRDDHGLSLQPNFSWLTGNHTSAAASTCARRGTRARSTATCSASISTAASRSARSTPGDALSGNALASFLLGAPQRRRHRQQLLPDVPLELLRAVDPGRLEDRQSPDAEPRPAVGLQHAGVRGAEPHQLHVRHLHGEPGATSLVQQRTPGYVVRGGLDVRRRQRRVRSIRTSATRT